MFFQIKVKGIGSANNQQTFKTNTNTKMFSTNVNANVNANKTQDMGRLSLYIPHVFNNFNEAYIAKVFEKLSLGRVSRVDLIAKLGRNGKPYNVAYVHFEEWFDNSSARNFQALVKDPEREARLIHDEPWYWIVLENKGKKHVAGQRKQRINLLDEDTYLFDPETNPDPEPFEEPFEEPEPFEERQERSIGHKCLFQQWCNQNTALIEENARLMEENARLMEENARLKQENEKLDETAERATYELDGVYRCLDSQKKTISQLYNLYEENQSLKANLTLSEEDLHRLDAKMSQTQNQLDDAEDQIDEMYQGLQEREDDLLTKDFEMSCLTMKLKECEDNRKEIINYVLNTNDLQKDNLNGIAAGYQRFEEVDEEHQRMAEEYAMDQEQEDREQEQEDQLEQAISTARCLYAGKL